MATPQINDEVFIRYPSNYDDRYTRGRITKITAGGQISVRVGENPELKRFNKDGDELGGSSSSFYRARLEFDVAAVEKTLADRDEQKRHDKAVSAVLEKINSHKNGFGTFHIDAAAKAELLELVNQL